MDWLANTVDMPSFSSLTTFDPVSAAMGATSMASRAVSSLGSAANWASSSPSTTLGDDLTDLVRKNREQIDDNRAELERRGLDLDYSRIRVPKTREGYQNAQKPTSRGVWVLGGFIIAVLVLVAVTISMPHMRTAAAILSLFGTVLAAFLYTLVRTNASFRAQQAEKPEMLACPDTHELSAGTCAPRDDNLVRNDVTYALDGATYKPVEPVSKIESRDLTEVQSVCKAYKGQPFTYLNAIQCPDS